MNEIKPLENKIIPSNKMEMSAVEEIENRKKQTSSNTEISQPEMESQDHIVKKQITKIHQEISEMILNKNELKNENNSDKQEGVIIKGKTYKIDYVPRESIYPAFGYADSHSACIREDLPPKVKNFVKAHELYHCQDDSNFGGWLGKEIRANFFPGLKDPLGLLATIKASLTKDRLKFYLNRFKGKY